MRGNQDEEEGAPGKVLALSILGVLIAFPVGYALMWLYVSLLPGVYQNLWPMWIGSGMTLAVCYWLVDRFIHGKSI
jgi:hypothetical protein